ncbi:MAG: hypothetical protein HOM11_07255 [Methylococcales bacterium]|jgi:hypothetical protein|nr:hypothetical protein [Methylococcales bacterium]MBT7443526.1 hypothetical protein [Methylococcales bacterium]
MPLKFTSLLICLTCFLHTSLTQAAPTRQQLKNAFAHKQQLRTFLRTESNINITSQPKIPKLALNSASRQNLIDVHGDRLIQFSLPQAAIDHANPEATLNSVVRNDQLVSASEVVERNGELFLSAEEDSEEEPNQLNKKTLKKQSLIKINKEKSFACMPH